MRRVALDRWSLWSVASLRAPGFGARGVLALASSELAAAADRVLDAEADVARCRDELVVALRAAVERNPEGRAGIGKAQKRLAQQKVPEEPIAEAEAEGARLRMVKAVSVHGERQRELGAQYDAARQETSVALRVAAGDERFRQAVVWQNRSLLRTMLDWIARQPVDAGDTTTRQKEYAIATYIQRYCVKNDTIGFFGPAGWARFVDDAEPLVMVPGPTLIADREVSYEYWTVDAVAARLSKDPTLRPAIAPRRLPQFRIEGTTLHHPIERTSELPAEFAAVLARCDGECSARAIAAVLLEDPDLGLTEEAEVYAILDELVESKLATWEITVPPQVAHPEQALAACVARIVAPIEPAGELANPIPPTESHELAPRIERAVVAPAERATDVVGALEKGRSAVATATTAAALDSALSSFEDTFVTFTQMTGQRASGQTYAGRTLLYEDCRRDLDVRLGRPVLARLGPPLELVLDSARWFTYEIARRYRQRLDDIYHELAPAGGAVDFARFWQHVPPLFPGGNAQGSIVHGVHDELQQHWQAILAIVRGEQIVRRRARDLADAVRTRLAAPHPGWPSARHHSPDVMIAAAGPEAFSRGDFTFVLGELHVGMNTLTSMVAARQYPAFEEFVAAREADLPRVGIAPVWSKAISRADFYSLSRHDVDLENGVTRSARPRAQVVEVSELVVEPRGGRLEVGTRSGTHCFDVIAFLEHHLIAESYAGFSLIAPAAHTPRVIIDDVVIARETWRIDPAQLAWTKVTADPASADPRGRFVAARRWARSLGLPRQVFVKTPKETKPVYVDFDSTVYVDVLGRLLRGAPAATISEMLPAVEQAWVVDREGTRYTSELRIAAVDPEEWQP